MRIILTTIFISLLFSCKMVSLPSANKVEIKDFKVYCDSFPYVAIYYLPDGVYHISFTDYRGWRGEFYSKDIFYTDSSLTLYYNNGKKRLVGRHANDTSNFRYNLRCGEFDGYFIYYDTIGNKIADKSYRNRKQYGTYLEFYQNGILKLKGNYEDNQEQGWWYYFSNEGELFKREYYKWGSLDGEYCEWFLNGELKIKGWYTVGKKDRKWYYFNKKGELDSTTEYKAPIGRKPENTGEPEMCENINVKARLPDFNESHKKLLEDDISTLIRDMVKNNKRFIKVFIKLDKNRKYYLTYKSSEGRMEVYKQLDYLPSDFRTTVAQLNGLKGISYFEIIYN